MRTLLLLVAMTLPALAQSATPGRVLEVYDVRDILTVIQDFPDPFQGGTGAATPSIKTHLAPMVRSLLATTAKVDLKNGMLTVEATEEEQKAVSDLLRLYRKGRNQVISVSLRWIETDKSLAETTGTILSTKETSALIGKLDPKQIKMTPRITAFNGQLTHISSVTQLAYIRGYGRRVDESGKLVADSEVGVAVTGWAVAVRPTIRNGHIVLDDFRITMADRPEEPARIETPLGVVEDPKVQTSRVSAKPSLKAGESYLLGPLEKPFAKKGDPKAWALVSCELLELETVAEPEKK